MLPSQTKGALMLITPQRSIAPPPCWCGQSWQAHQESPARREPPARGGTPDHQFVPADGIESEAFDAW